MHLDFLPMFPNAHTDSASKPFVDFLHSIVHFGYAVVIQPARGKRF